MKLTAILAKRRIYFYFPSVCGSLQETSNAVGRISVKRISANCNSVNSDDPSDGILRFSRIPPCTTAV